MLIPQQFKRFSCHVFAAYVPNIVFVFYYCRKQKNITVEPSVFTCVSLLARAMGNDIHMNIRDLIGPMLHVPLRCVI